MSVSRIGRRTPVRLAVSTLAVLLLLGLLAATIGTGLLLTNPPSSKPLETDLSGKPFSVDAALADKVGAVVAPDSSVLQDQRLVIPAATLNVPLETMRSDPQVVLPPRADRAYQVLGFGGEPNSATSATTYVAMHSVVGGRGPGNHLFDQATGSLRLNPSDAIELGSLKYKVATVKVMDKESLASNEAVWDSTVPGRLVLLTCFIRPDGKTEENLVVEADLAA